MHRSSSNPSLSRVQTAQTTSGDQPSVTKPAWTNADRQAPLELKPGSSPFKVPAARLPAAPTEDLTEFREQTPGGLKAKLEKFNPFARRKPTERDPPSTTRLSRSSSSTAIGSMSSPSLHAPVGLAKSSSSTSISGDGPGSKTSLRSSGARSPGRSVSRRPDLAVRVPEPLVLLAPYDTLQATLADPTARAMFMRFLQSEFNQQPLNFMEACHALAEIPEEDQAAFAKTARASEIMNKFIGCNASEQINLAWELESALIAEWTRVQQTPAKDQNFGRLIQLLTSAVDEVERTLGKDNFGRFQKHLRQEGFEREAPLGSPPSSSSISSTGLGRVGPVVVQPRVEPPVSGEVDPAILELVGDIGEFEDRPRSETEAKKAPARDSAFHPPRFGNDLD